MKCPVCKDVNLVMSERQGIEIDYCPQCRGIWLDRGELDKLIERSEAARPAEAPGAEPRREERYRDRPEPRGHREDYRHKRRGSFLGELFDFD